MYTRYRHLVIQDADPAPEDYEIREVERELGAKLPYDFKKFLEVGNGGYLHDYNVSFPLSNRIVNYSFGTFFSTKQNEWSWGGHFIGEMRFAQSLDEGNPYCIPQSVLPIASNGNGDSLYLDFGVAEHPVVTAFPHEERDTKELEAEGARVRVANSFTEYVDSLEFASVYYKKQLKDLINQDDKKQIRATIDYLEKALPNWRKEFGLQDYDDGRPKQLKMWDWL